MVIRLRPSVTPKEAERWKLLHDEASSTVVVPSDDGGSPVRKYRASAVCGPESTQEQLYEHVKPAVSRALGGGRSAIVCYGGVGSGKSYTLLETHIGEWGVAPRVFTELCLGVQKRRKEGAEINASLHALT